MKIPVFVILMSLLSSVSHAVELLTMDLTRQNNKESVLLTFDGPFSYRSLTLNHPPRVAFDFKNAKHNQRYKKPSFDSDYIGSVRQARNKQGTLRIVLDLKKDSFAIKHLKKTNNTLLISLENKSDKRSKNPSPIVESKLKGAREVVIVLDPGHGGKDPGARGAKGTKEKEVVLKIAKVLQKELNRQEGIKAYLTRDTDKYISLRKRLEIAREKDADLFVSIHADAFINKKSRGASVFALSPKGATSEAARWLAEKENYSELGGVDLGKLQDATGVVRSVLIDLSQTATTRASLLLGKVVLNKLDELTVLHHNKVEQAPFVVLKSPDIPSILVETGFITNPNEEKNLKSPWYHRQLSKALTKGINAYFNQYPPHGTYFAMRERIYNVQKGDSLYRIAKKKAISLKELMRYNNLDKSSELLVGQRLKLPS